MPRRRAGAGHADSRHDPLGAWAKIDRWVVACHDRGLNLLLQPVMSGNGIAPPPWAGYRPPLGYGEPQTWTDPAGRRHRTGPSVTPGLPRAPIRMDAVSFHSYEDLDGSTGEEVYRRQKAWWDRYASQPGFEFDPRLPYWMTEGGRLLFDDEGEKARFFPQYLARGLGAGVDRMIVQDVADGRSGMAAVTVTLRRASGYNEPLYVVETV